MALTSVISNSVKDPNGGAVANCLVEVRLMPTAGFRIDDGLEVARVKTTLTDVNGAWSLALERNSNISPASTYYEVVEYIPDAQGGRRVWLIQVGAAPASVSSSLVTPTQVQVSQYLTQALGDARYQLLGAPGGAVAAVNMDDFTGSQGVSSAGARADHDHPVASVAWTTFTPTLVQGATTFVLNTQVARYARVGRMIHVQFRATVTSGTGTANNPIRLTLPFTAANSGNILACGNGWINDQSAVLYYPAFTVLDQTTTLAWVQCDSAIANANALRLGETGAVMAAQLTATDFLSADFIYESAS